MATLEYFESFSEALAEKAHDLGSDQLQIAMVAAADAPSLSADTVLADLAEITYTNLSGTNPRYLTTTSGAQTGGTYKLVLEDLTLTASGGSVGPFRYIVVFNQTAASDELIGMADYGSDYTITDGKSFVVGFDQTNGAITVAPA